MKFTGGIHYGSSYYNALNATWPFATLIVEPDKILLNTTFFSSFTFPQSQIKALSKYSGFFSKGLLIEHEITNYPSFIVFWTFDFRSVESGLIENGYTVRVGKK